MAAKRNSDSPRTRSDGSARDRLLAAALDRFGADGPVGVSLEEVRGDAGVSVGALYHHFTDKAALFEAVYVDVVGRFQDGFLLELHAHPDAQEGIEAGVRFYLGWVAAHRPAANILLGTRPDSAALRDRNRAFFGEVVAWWNTHVHYGAVRSLPADVVYALWLGPASEYARHWVAGRTTRPPTAVVEVLAAAAWSALKEPQMTGDAG